jgi:hypothetical protein
MFRKSFQSAFGLAMRYLITVPAAFLMYGIGSSHLFADDLVSIVRDTIYNEDNRFLARIKRTIGKEPVYRGQPKYILIALGKEARHRVWVVVDDDHAYFDLNGNGNLTDQGEAFKLKKNAIYDPEWSCEIDGLYDPISKLRHDYVQIRPGAEGYIRISMDAAFANRWRPKLYGSANVRYSTKPANAPVVHFGGHPAMELGIVTEGSQAVGLSALIGTHGIGTGSFVYYRQSVFDIATGGPFGRLPQPEARLWPPLGEQKKRLPEVLLEYENEKGLRVREQSKFGYDLFERVYWRSIVPGEKNDNRKVKVTMSFMEWFEGDIGMRERTVPFFRLRK